jgi:hypothetical protein
MRVARHRSGTTGNTPDLHKRIRAKLSYSLARVEATHCLIGANNVEFTRLPARLQPRPAPENYFGIIPEMLLTNSGMGVYYSHEHIARRGSPATQG